MQPVKRNIRNYCYAKWDINIISVYNGGIKYVLIAEFQQYFRCSHVVVIYQINVNVEQTNRGCPILVIYMPSNPLCTHNAEPLNLVRYLGCSNTSLVRISSPASKNDIYTIKQNVARYRAGTIPNESRWRILKWLLICFQRYRARKNFQQLRAIASDSHYYAPEDQSRVHTRHGTQNEDVVAVIVASVECAATRGPIGRLFEMQILRLPSVYSVVFCDKRTSCTHLCARGTGRACREFTGQWWRLADERVCAHQVDSIEHKSPIFVTRKKEKKCHPKEYVLAGQPETFPIKVLAIRNDRRDTTPICPVSLTLFQGGYSAAAVRGQIKRPDRPAIFLSSGHNVPVGMTTRSSR